MLFFDLNSIQPNKEIPMLGSLHKRQSISACLMEELRYFWVRFVTTEPADILTITVVFIAAVGFLSFVVYMLVFHSWWELIGMTRRFWMYNDHNHYRSSLMAARLRLWWRELKRQYPYTDLNIGILLVILIFIATVGFIIYIARTAPSLEWP